MADKLTPEQRQALLQRYRNPVVSEEKPGYGFIATPSTEFDLMVSSLADKPGESHRAIDSMTTVTRYPYDPRENMRNFEQFLSPATKRMAVNLNRDWADWVRSGEAVEGDDPYNPNWRVRDTGPDPVNKLREAIESDLAANFPGYQTDIYGSGYGAHHDGSMGVDAIGADKSSALRRAHPNLSLASESPEDITAAIYEALEGHKSGARDANPQFYANRPGYRGDTYLKKARLGLEHLREARPDRRRLIADLDAAVTAAEQSYKPLQGPAEFPTEAIKRQAIYGER